MCDQRANPDVLVSKIAARQYGVVSVAQLRAAGLDKHRVRHRAQTGHLHPIHRGVYAVGHSRVPPEGRWMAAVLACGGDAAVSHRSAASLWELLPNQAGMAVDISVPGGGGRRTRVGIRIHRSLSLRPESITRRNGIPTTTPARTISDLQRTVSPVEHRRAVRQAEVLGLRIDPDISRDGTRSELEFRFLALCKENGLPAPEINIRIGSLLVDFVWRDQRLIVETDGYRYHRGRVAFEEDRVRDLKLRALGFDVIRLTHRQTMDNPKEVVGAVKRALSR